MKGKLTRKRLQLAAEQGWQCCYCGVQVRFDVPQGHPDEATVEHVTRRADKGERVWENEVIACCTCNNSRGEEDAYAYFYRIQAQGRPRPVRWSEPYTNRSGRNAPPLPPPPLTAKIVEYLVLAHGRDTAAALIRERIELGAEVPPGLEVPVAGRARNAR